MALQTFMSYFGGKGSLAKMYPPPRFDTVVEPFAGGAGYSLLYHTKNVVLIEKNIKVFKLWNWLINVATREDILALPTKVEDVKKLDICLEAQYLIGWWVNSVHCSPCRTPSSWMRKILAQGKDPHNFWGVHIRARIARQVPMIKHWRVYHGDYAQAADVVKGDATWFVDPPYQQSGFRYPESSKKLNFDALGDWCRHMGNRGQVIVCEQEGSDWMDDFQPLHIFSRGGLKGAKSGREVVWLSDGNYRKRAQGFGLEGSGLMVRADDIPKNLVGEAAKKRRADGLTDVRGVVIRRAE